MDNSKKINFGEMDVPQLFMKILLPTLLGMVASIIVTITDGFFVGKYAGSDALASVNIAAPLFMISTGCALMFGTGCSIFTAIQLSRRKIKLANNTITQAVFISVFLFVFLSIFIILFPKHVAKLLGSTHHLLPFVTTYITILTPSLVFYMLMNIGLFIIRLDGSPKYAMSCSLIPAIFNIAGDYVLVGKMGMGIKGAVLATSISFIIGGIMVLLYMFIFSKTLKLQHIKFSIKSFLITVRNVTYMCKLGFSGLLSELAIALMALMGNYIFLKYLGEDGIAAYSVICYYFPVVFMINNAIAQSAQPIISYNLGNPKTDRVHQTLKIALQIALGFGFLLTLAMSFLAPQMVNVFLDYTSPAYTIAVKGIPLFSVGFIFFAFNIIYIGYYQSIGYMRKATIVTFMRGYLFLFISFIVLPNYIGVKGIWLSIPCAEFLTFIALTWIIHKERVSLLSV